MMEKIKQMLNERNINVTISAGCYNTGVEWKRVIKNVGRNKSEVE